ncbi:MAG: glycerol-3-phosphate 1-O-acyltransferase PlsY [Defluviitaleaceae bacterium]|nr:glycerol-3-phosphate 1-O-acyltransferase PlsY [Defluviitaleaceae bacterium]
MWIEFMRIPCLVIGYAFGCIQSAYIISKLMAGIDIRQHGSGNAGASNVQRVLGNRTGALVLACDILKAVAAYFVCYFAFRALPLAGLYAGIGVILGHNFPFFLKFKGGRGIASSVGLFLCLDWRVALCACAVGLIALAVFRFMSLMSLIIVLLFPIGLIVAGARWEEVLVCFLVTIMAYIQHRGNLKRLFTGTERKISFKKREKNGKTVNKTVKQGNI